MTIPGRQSTLNTNSAVPTTMLLAVSLLYVILSSSSTLSYLLTRFLPRSKHEVLFTGYLLQSYIAGNL